MNFGAKEYFFCFISFGYYIKLVVFIWMCFEYVFEERKKILVFEIRYFLCGGCKKKKYNSVIFLFINDRCCFIVVNIVFYALWSIICLFYVLKLYIVYIWFYLCKKKFRYFIVYILRFYYKINLYWGIELLLIICVVFLLFELFFFFKRNEFMNYCF